MATAFTVKTHGFAELATRLTAMPDDLMVNHIVKANTDACTLVRDVARTKAPMHMMPYPPSRTKAMTAKQVTAQVKKLDKLGISDENKELAIWEMFKGKSAKSTGRQAANRLRSPGQLKKGIVLGKVNLKDKNHIEQSVRLSSRAYYGQWIERGFTHYGVKKFTHIPARPFLRPALDQNVERALSVYRNALNDGLNHVGAK